MSYVVTIPENSQTVKLGAPYTIANRFLDGIYKILKTDGAEPMILSDNTIQATLFSGEQGSISCERDDSWENYEDSRDENCLLIIHSDGDVSIEDGMDYFEHLSATLASSDELLEFVTFFTTADAEKEQLNNPEIVKEMLTEIIEDIYLLIPTPSETAPLLLPLMNNKILNTLPANFAECTSAFIDKDWDRIQKIGYATLHQLIEEENLTETVEKHSEKIQLGDYVITPEKSFTYAGQYLSSAVPLTQKPPAFVLRLKDNISKLWFANYLENHRNGQKLIKTVVKSWQNLENQLKDITVKIPKLKNAQIAEIIKFAVRIRK